MNRLRSATNPQSPLQVKGVTAQLAEFAATAVVCSSLADTVRIAVVDCFGSIMAGAASEVAHRVSDALAGGNEGNTMIYATGRTASPGVTALLNGVAGHAFDLDDWEEPANTHPSVVILPACLAAAHIKRISGEDLVSAYAVGFEVIARLGQYITIDHYKRGFHSTGTIGAIGATAAVSRLLKLDISSTIHALSIAASQASGFCVQFGTNVKPLQAGFAARAAIESAVLARAGVTGHLEVLESERGFAGLMGVKGGELNNVGNPWALEEYGVSIKPWPSCGYTHRLMTAAVDLRPQIIDRLKSITKIHATLPDFHKDIMPYDRPDTREQALFSLPACIAQVLVGGDLTLSDLAAKYWEKPLVRHLIERTCIESAPARNPNLNLDPAQPDRLRIQLENQLLERVCTYPLGSTQNPIDNDRLAAKFTANSNLSIETFEHLLNWPESADLRQFFNTCITLKE